jgi:hypothetical protein
MSIEQLPAPVRPTPTELLSLLARYASVCHDALDAFDAIVATLVENGYPVFDAADLRWCPVCGIAVLPTEAFIDRLGTHVCGNCATYSDDELHDIYIKLQYPE